MQIQFLGATNTVTGSKYLVTSGAARILVDCGLFQGYKQLRLRNWEPVPVPLRELDAVVLTHAHLDHSGYIPLLVRNGFKGRIYCSEATRELCGILLPDSGHLLEEEAAFANRHGYSKHSPALPLYTADDAKRALAHLHAVDFGKRFSPARGVEAMLLPAGHILGAAGIQLHAEGRTLTFSGDLGRLHDRIMLPPAVPPGTNYLVVESTYGGRRHDAEDPLVKLGHVIRVTAGRGGVTVIPAFAVGRAQELLFYIHLLKQTGKIPPYLPVYLNSPMAVSALEIYRRHRKEHRLDPQECDAMCHAATIINSVEESMALNRRHVPMVIVAASGMATGGRVLHHLKSFAPDPRNTILFAGYQAGGTRGAAMVAGVASIKIHGDHIPVRAQVEQIGNLSAHADGDEIIEWLSRFPSTPQRTFITHGEPESADMLRQRIERELKWGCSVPDYRDTFTLA